MSDVPQSPNQSRFHETGNKLAAAAASVVLLASGYSAEAPPQTDNIAPYEQSEDGIEANYAAIPADPESTPYLPLNTQMRSARAGERLFSPNELTPLEIPRITPEIRAMLRRETVYLEGNGCSASLIRNRLGEPVGVATAEHCGLRGEQSRRIPGDDGRLYIFRDEPVFAAKGNKRDKLKAVSEISQFLVQPSTDTQSDLAFGVFKGHSPEEVLDNYQFLSDKEIAGLNVGDAVYMSGWPVDQDNNPGVMRRQVFAMPVIGKSSTRVSSGENIPVVWTAVPSNKYGAECSFGASGSIGYVISEVKDSRGRSQLKAESIGTLAAFDDLVGDTVHTPEVAASVKAYFEQQFKVDLTDMAAVCGFSYTPIPSQKNGGEVVNVVYSTDQVPGYNEHLKAEYQLQEARKNFLDSTYERKVIDGLVKFPVMTDAGERYEIVVDRPVVFYDRMTEQVVVGWHDEAAEDNLALQLLPNTFGMEVYSRDATLNMDILSAVGEVDRGGTDKAGNPITSFGTDNLAIFGQVYHKSFNTENAEWFYTLHAAPDGELHFKIAQRGGGKGGLDTTNQ